MQPINKTSIMTAITINIPNRKVGFFKKLIAEMGWTYEVKEEIARPKVKPRLYDPETGECLNDKTMKAIEDVRSGKDKGTTYSSFEDFEKSMRAREEKVTTPQDQCRNRA